LHERSSEEEESEEEAAPVAKAAAPVNDGVRILTAINPINHFSLFNEFTYWFGLMLLLSSSFYCFCSFGSFFFVVVALFAPPVAAICRQI